MNSSDTWEGLAPSWSAIGFRMGSTSPIPMKEMTEAKATDQTVLD